MWINGLGDCQSFCHGQTNHCASGEVRIQTYLKGVWWGCPVASDHYLSIFAFHACELALKWQWLKREESQNCIKAKALKAFSSSNSEHNGTWSRQQSIKIGYALLTSSDEVQRTKRNLTVIYLDTVAFAYVLNYKIYVLQNPSINYNGKFAARLAKLAMRMGTLMKPYRFEDDDPVTILSFLFQ